MNFKKNNLDEIFEFLISNNGKKIIFITNNN